MTNAIVITGGKAAAYPDAKQAWAAAEMNGKAFIVTSEKDLLHSSLTGAQLVALWNGLDGLTPVKKFTSRKVAAERLWEGAPGAQAAKRP